MEKRGLNTTEYIKILKESPEKKKSYIFIGVTIAVAIALIIFAIRPTILTITRINKEIKDKQRIDTALTQKIETLTELDKQYTQAKDSFSGLALIYPANANFSLLLANIESIVSRNGYSLGSVGFDKYDKNENYNISAKYLVPWSLRVTAKGRVGNIINLLKDFESMPMYPVVESLSYSSQVDKDGLTTFGINMRIYHIEDVNFYK